MKVTITDNSDKTIEQLKKCIERGLEAVGMTLETRAKKNCPVDTGRLRNSITYATYKKQGTPNTSGGANAEPQDYKKQATPKENQVVIGTNVEYAELQEEANFTHKTGGAHYMRKAITENPDELKKIIETSLKAG